MVKGWFRKAFSGKRVITSITFSAVVGVTYWATTLYEKAFNAQDTILAIKAFLVVALVLLIFGGNLLDAMSRSDVS